MAPRSPQQQIAYNQKRRDESAAKTQAKLEAMASKLQGQPAAAKKADKTVDRAPVEERVNGKMKALGARFKGNANAGKIAPVNIELKAREKAMRKLKPGEKGAAAKRGFFGKATKVKAKRDPATGAQVMVTTPPEPKIIVEKKGRIVPPPKDKAAEALAQRDKANARLAGNANSYDTPPPKVLFNEKHPLSLAPPPVTVGAGTPSMHTMARSYLRSGAPGLGKLRGSTYQATVSFTPVQMAQVVEAAKFRGVSLAEMIRSAVVEHLNKGM